MTEGRMAEIVAEAGTFDEIGVDEAVITQHLALLRQPGADAAADLSHLDAVREPRAVEIILAGQKHLRLALQPAKRAAVDDAVAVDLKRIAILAGRRQARVERFKVEVGVKAVRGHAWCATMLAGHGRRARPLLSLGDETRTGSRASHSQIRALPWPGAFHSQRQA
jgi:hypothetical protein